MGVTIASSSLPLQQVRPPGAATSFNKALILYTVSQYPSSCNAKKEKKKRKNCSHLNNLSLCRCRSLQKQTWSNQTSFWFRLRGSGRRKGEDKSLLTRRKKGMDASRRRSKGWEGNAPGAIRTLFFFFFHTRRCRTVDCTAFCDTASLPTVTSKHLGATVLRITGDESNWMGKQTEEGLL